MNKRGLCAGIASSKVDTILKRSFVCRFVSLYPSTNKNKSFRDRGLSHATGHFVLAPQGSTATYATRYDTVKPAWGCTFGPHAGNGALPLLPTHFLSHNLLSVISDFPEMDHPVTIAWLWLCAWGHHTTHRHCTAVGCVYLVVCWTRSWVVLSCSRRNALCILGRLCSEKGLSPPQKFKRGPELDGKLVMVS